jgi:hypothetical protein
MNQPLQTEYKHTKIIIIKQDFMFTMAAELTSYQKWNLFEVGHKH